MTGGADPALLSVSGFIQACIERSGGAVEAAGAERIDALLPAELEAIAGRSWASLALTGDGGGQDSIPATVGSPFLDGLIAFATGRGTVACGHLPPGQLKRKGLREEAERVLRFSNCRTRYRDDSAEVRLSATVQFDFKVALLSEERRERIEVVTVDLFTGLANQELAARLSNVAIAAEAGGQPVEAPLVSLETAYETARSTLREEVSREAARYQVRVGQRFAVEFARIHDYYEQVIQEIERRRERERQRLESVSARGEGLAQKVAAAREERERKLRELGETYRIRTRARLTSVRCLWQPKVFFKVLIDRGALTRSLTLVYDGLLERLSPIACESCRQPATRLLASSEARLHCPPCSAREGSSP